MQRAGISHDRCDTASVRSLRHDQIFGYEEPQSEWEQEIALRHVLPEDQPAFRQAFARAVETGVLSFEVVRTLEAEATRAGLDLNLRSGDGESALVWTDPGKVRQILLNLVGNAIRYTRQGEVTVEVDRFAPEWLTVHIRDTGPGIAPEDQERVFESFTQVDSSLTRTAGGTGLGIAISRRLAQLLGGDVALQSTPGEGSRFALSLPRREGEGGGWTEGAITGLTSPDPEQVSG